MRISDWSSDVCSSDLAALDIEQRQTLCNMATEMSAFCAIIAPDEQVFAALEGRPFAPHGAAWDAAVAQWRGLASHPDARFDREVTVDAAEDRKSTRLNSSH